MLEINSMRYAHDNCFYITKVLVFSIKFISNNNIHTPFMNKHIIYTDTYICIYVNVCVESSNLAVNLKRFYRQRKSNDISYTYVHTYICIICRRVYTASKLCDNSSRRSLKCNTFPFDTDTYHLCR